MKFKEIRPVVSDEKSFDNVDRQVTFGQGLHVTLASRNSNGFNLNAVVYQRTQHQQK